MIGIRDFFVEMGTSAERRAGELSERGDALQARRAAYDQIEAHFSQMAADGVIDPKEMQQLVGELKSAGLETFQLEEMYRQLKGTDSSVRVDGASDFERALGGEIRAARAGVDDQLFALGREIDRQKFFIDTGFATASDLNKKEHDVYMAIIKHMVA